MGRVAKYPQRTKRPKRGPAAASPRNRAEPTLRNVARADHIGVTCHHIIGWLLEQGVREPSFADIAKAVSDHPITNATIASKLHSRQRLLSTIGIYFGLFERAPEWRLISREETLVGGRPDLVFASRNGGIEFDEIKAGRAADFIDDVEEQVDRYLILGAERYREDFAGVRVLLLASPKHSFFAAVDGSRRPLLAQELIA